eukprot:1140941-Pelagomonas_calceolata.AAC.5
MKHAHDLEHGDGLHRPSATVVRAAQEPRIKHVYDLAQGDGLCRLHEDTDQNTSLRLSSRQQKRQKDDGGCPPENFNSCVQL